MLTNKPLLETMVTKRSAPTRAAETRRRILLAAREEIIAHGAAGARVDRIATLAKTSKERIYFYFRNKAELVAAVAAEHASSFQTRIDFVEEDVLTFVGAMFDFYCTQHEEVTLWLRLLVDTGDEEISLDDPRVIWLQQRIDTVRNAQRAGTIDPAWDPIMLLNLLSSLAASWAIAPTYVNALRAEGTGPQSQQGHRKAVLEIAAHMLNHAPQLD